MKSFQTNRAIYLRLNKGTCATSLKKGNISIEKIADMLGQTSTAVTRRYLDSFYQDEVHRVNSVLP